MRRGSAFSFALLMLTAHGHALAQESVPVAAVDKPNNAANIEAYPLSFFSDFQPNTALDMVLRVPGFTLRSGGSERGFGVADTNILINGRRPSTKSQSATDILSRISAQTVKRIEILDGASLDIPGLNGQVANIVAASVDLSGNWRYAARFEEGTEPQLLEAEVSLAGTRGDFGFTVGIESGHFTFTETSVETFFDADRTVIEDRTENVFLRNLQPSANLAVTWTPEGGRFAGHVANLNVSGEIDNDNSGVRETFQPVGGIFGESFVQAGSDEFQIEVGADYAFPVKLFGMDGTLKLIGLNRIEEEDGQTVFVLSPGGGVQATRQSFTEDVREGETIGRVEYGFKPAAAHDVQLSGEYAFNFLEADTGFQFQLDPIDTNFVRVEEDRFNARITDSWQIRPDLSLQASIGAEYSRLQVVNPTSEARKFLRPKGFAAISYTLSDLYAVRGRIERSVGQLNFGTFVSDRNLADNILTSGNAQIKPSQSWDISVDFERTDDQLLSGQITPFFEYIEDPIDRILIGDAGAEGPGNLDSATRFGVTGNATLLFDTLGIPGLILEADLTLSDSSIDDPLTGNARQINFNEKWDYELFARYDLPGTDFAFTADIENDQSSPFFRLDDIRTVEVDKPFVGLEFIHKNFFGMQLSVRGSNLLDNTVIQVRERFLGPDRRLGELTRIERFERQRGRRLSFVLRSTF